MAITWLAAGVAYELSSYSLARSMPDDENGRRSMKEARLLSERASERATSIALPERGKDLFVEGSSNFGVTKMIRVGRKPVVVVCRPPTYHNSRAMSKVAT